MFNINPWKGAGHLSTRDNLPLSSFQNEINRLFSDFFDEKAITATKGSDSSFLAPAIDVTEDDAGFKITAELAGLNSDDIDVDINNNYLTIKGVKETSSEDEDKNFIRRERSYGSFQRTMALPDTADIEKVEANFEKGLLQINVPKKEESISTSRKVDIGKADAEGKNESKG